MQRTLSLLVFVLIVGGLVWYAVQPPPNTSLVATTDTPPSEALLLNLDLYEQLGDLAYSATESDWKWLLATDAEIQTGVVHP